MHVGTLFPNRMFTEDSEAEVSVNASSRRIRVKFLGGTAWPVSSVHLVSE